MGLVRGFILAREKSMVFPETYGVLVQLHGLSPRVIVWESWDMNGG
jgi:hypothetical protein